jgi:hypothetical protein
MIFKVSRGQIHYSGEICDIADSDKRSHERSHGQADSAAHWTANGAAHPGEWAPRFPT